ncbi:MAG: hypothetical protein EOP33_02210 [Rickettsiaceae bacterium]|nr:MAG: hypothetical protein EOP33_02210 [Rickettsiaceae bacterium]
MVLPLFIKFWETEHIDWSEDEQKKIIENIKKLGLLAEINPIIEDVDAICILGSVMNDMKIRVKHATKLLNKNILSSKYILLLAGERIVTPEIDGIKKDLQNIAKKYNIELSKLTETHLLENIYENSAIHYQLPAFTINTLAGELPRPTTETTLFELAKWLQNNKDVKRIAFISDQPLVNYQTSIIRQVLKSTSPNIEFQVVGPAGSSKIKASSALAALGSYIWAQTPEVLCHLGYKITNRELKAKVIKLYQENKLIFSNLKHLL